MSDDIVELMEERLTMNVERLKIYRNMLNMLRKLKQAAGIRKTQTTREIVDNDKNPIIHKKTNFGEKQELEMMKQAITDLEIIQVEVRNAMA